MRVYVPLVLCCVLASIASAQCVDLVDHYLPPLKPPQYPDHVGTLIATSGDHAIVNAGARQSLSAVFTFLRVDGDWYHTGIEYGPFGFGGSLFIEDDLALIGAPNDFGSVFIYEYNGGQWSYQQELVSDMTYEFQRFGASVAKKDDLIVVGTPRDLTHGNDSGAAYVFRLIDDEWVMQEKLTWAFAHSYFGTSVLIDDDRVLISAPRSGNTGRVNVYEHDGLAWVHIDTIVPPDNFGSGRFGERMQLDGDRLYIGTPYDPTLGSEVGSLYVYETAGDGYAFQQKIEPTTLADPEHFGMHFHAQGDMLVVGQPLDSEFADEAGAAYLYQRQAGEFVPSTVVGAPDAKFGDAFAQGIALNGITLFSGAPGDDSVAGDVGSLYFYDVGGLADFNDDGVVNILDFVAFQLAWVAQDRAADCTGDGEFSILDFICFQAIVTTPCN